MGTFNLFADASLTDPLDPNISAHNIDGSNDPQDVHAYVGSPNAAKRLRAASNPGTDQLVLTIVQRTAQWQANHAYLTGDLVRPTTGNDNEYIYEAQDDGTSHASTEPSWPTTVGNQVVDNGVTWECVRKRHRPTEVKLATTQGGLAGATPGASLNLGTSISGGTGAKVDVWFRLDDATATLGTPSPTDLYLAILGCAEDEP
jgi:hypothetical protein